jgi:hypothetical protein
VLHLRCRSVRGNTGTTENKMVIVHRLISAHPCNESIKRGYVINPHSLQELKDNIQKQLALISRHDLHHAIRNIFIMFKACLEVSVLLQNKKLKFCRLNRQSSCERILQQLQHEGI